MTHTQDIRRRTDGSIDTNYFLAQSRVHRSDAAQAMVGKSLKHSGGVLAALVALAALSPFLLDEVKFVDGGFL